MSLGVNTLISHYRIIAPLGKGGMGEVYIAEDTKLKRRVALKILPAVLSLDSARLGRFQREAEAIAALSHPNVVTIHSVEEADGIRFITMELIEGQTLAQMIPPGGMDLEPFFRIAVPMAEALHAAHEKGIIHRDLKPANVMVTDDGRVKILDFGLAKWIQATNTSEDSQIETSDHTKTGLIIGTAPYMSPEQALGQSLDTRTDIFSFGIVLYQLASGRLPFSGASVVQILSDIIHSDVPAIKSIASPVEQIIRRCLEKDPSKRYGSVKELLSELRAARDAVTTGGPTKKAKEPQHNLPVQVTTFIGREEEVAELRELLRSYRLVTMTGAGGSGKTRLAFESAMHSLADFPDGVWQVSLASLTSSDLVLQSIAEALDAPKGERPLIENLKFRIANRNILIILDNCEHVLEEIVRIVDIILHTSADIRILATSREALNVAGEHVWTVPTLTVPSVHAALTVESAARFDAVKLFVERAVAREPRFTLNESNLESVVGICAGLDGIPLAIELAAARIKVMSASEIRKRLNDCFQILSVGSRAGIQRHQTLRAAVDWSHDLLSPEERLLFRRLACFAGSFDLDAAEVVCGWGELDQKSILDHLTRLIDKSLVISERNGEDLVRYRLLEPLRQYASEKLISNGEADSFARRHFDYYAAMADRAYEQRIEFSTTWLAKLEENHDNLRAAVEWASREDSDRELRLAGALAWFWQLHSHFTEGRRRLRKVLERTGEHTRETARALCGASFLAAFQGDFYEGREPSEAGLAIWRELGDMREIALALEIIGWQTWFGGDIEGGMKAFQECLRIFEQLENERLINRAKLNICQLLVSEFKVDETEPIAQEGLRIALKYDDLRDIHFAYHFLADCALIRGEVAAAKTRYTDSLRAAVRYGDRFEITFELEGIAMALAGAGSDRSAMRLEGAVQAELDALNSVVTISFWLQLRERFLKPAEIRLGPEAAEKEKQIGRSMGFEAAIDYALA